MAWNLVDGAILNLLGPLWNGVENNSQEIQNLVAAGTFWTGCRWKNYNLCHVEGLEVFVNSGWGSRQMPTLTGFLKQQTKLECTSAKIHLWEVFQIFNIDFQEGGKKKSLKSG